MTQLGCSMYVKYQQNYQWHFAVMCFMEGSTRSTCSHLLGHLKFNSFQGLQTMQPFPCQLLVTLLLEETAGARRKWAVQLVADKLGIQSNLVFQVLEVPCRQTLAHCHNDLQGQLCPPAHMLQIMYLCTGFGLQDLQQTQHTCLSSSPCQQLPRQRTTA